MQLTENFSLAEMIKSETALRQGLENVPGEIEIQNLKMLCEQVLQPLRDAYQRGIKVNSGFRHPDVNAAVGGSRTSDIVEVKQLILKFLELQITISQNTLQNIFSLLNLF